MERDLKQYLENLKRTKSAKELSNYFTWDFADDYAPFEKYSPAYKPVLSFLNDKFIDIDTDYSDSKEFEEKVFSTIEIAIKMLT